ncbi:MAG: DUF2875 family protein [Stenotrophomonas sp.]|jgi:hypothetical protein|uniref:DUF2875 family protein n=2 Tax=Gammaproteobacteria TaxID=1236 RepID=UPI0028475981|nr:DUF2875 family protein [Stenotrophomonas sp.]MDR2958102.1 DUF2875 family protein [Stenotrophomonas sp.]
MSRSVWALGFLLLTLVWSVLMVLYATDPAESAGVAALVPWLAGTIMAALACTAGHALQQAFVPPPPRPSPQPPARAPSSVASALHVRACHAWIAGRPVAELASTLALDQHATPAEATHRSVDNDSAEHGMRLQVQLALAMDMLVTHVPDAGPLPILTLAPPATETSRYAARHWPGLMKMQSDQPARLLVRERDLDGSSLVPLLRDLHRMMDETPLLDSIALLSVDGRLIRGDTGRQTSRQPSDDSIVLLWVSREQLPSRIRKESIAGARADTGALRAPYRWWRDEMESMIPPRFATPETHVHPSSTWQQAMSGEMTEGVPEGAAGAHHPWYPAPWTHEQVSQWDAVPVLASLPPPAFIPIKPHENVLTSAGPLQQRIAEAWNALIATLPGSAVHIWYDSHSEPGHIRALRLALAGRTEPIDLADPEHATDTHSQVGVLGSGAGASMLALAMHSGGNHVVVVASADGLLLQPVLSRIPSNQSLNEETA